MQFSRMCYQPKIFYGGLIKLNSVYLRNVFNCGGTEPLNRVHVVKYQLYTTFLLVNSP